MNQNAFVDKTIVTRAVITKIEDEKKPEKIWARHVPGYAPPEKIQDKEGQDWIPDITAREKEGIHIYEIELDQTAQLEKWRLFSRYAKDHNGRLTLVVPNKHLETIKRHVCENAIVADFIYFDTE